MTGMFGVWYLVLAFVLAPLLLDEEGFIGAYTSRRVISYLIVSLVAIFFPWLLSLLGARITGALSEVFWFNFALLIAPAWGVFVLFTHEDPLLDKVRGAWLIVIILLLVVTAISMFSKLRLPTGTGGLDIRPGETFGEMWDRFRESGKTIISNILGIPSRVGVFVNKNLNDTIGKNYMGQVDPYHDRELGVRFTDLRTFSSRIYADEEFFVWADITGESFREPIDMVVRCYATSGSSRDPTVYNGSVTVQGRSDGTLRIEGKERIPADCQFSGLPKGTYKVWFVGSFVFETWAYVQYYFAPEEKVLEAQRNNIDPALEAGIQEYPLAVYTSGPVEMGLGSNLPQPVGLDTLEPLEDLPSFGASITNAWVESGEVQSVRHISLLVPEPFLLKGCDRYDAQRHRGRSGADAMTPLEDHSIDGYREYTFGDVGDINSRFESVTCYLTLDGEDYSGESTPAQQAAARELLGGYDLVMKTFAAKTNYLYEIKESTWVTIDG